MPAGGRTGSPTAPTPSTRSRSCRWPRSTWPGRRGCWTWAPARASWPDGRRPSGASVVGVDPTPSQVAGRRRARGRTGVRPVRRRAAPVRRRRLRRGRRLPGLRAPAGPRAAHRGGGPGAPARRPVPLLPEPPAPAGARAAAGSTTRSWSRPSSTGGSGAYLVEDVRDEEVAPGVVLPFVHRPLSRYVNLMADAGLDPGAHGGAGPAARVPGPGHGVPAGRHHSPAPLPAGRTLARHTGSS